MKLKLLILLASLVTLMGVLEIERKPDRRDLGKPPPREWARDTVTGPGTLQVAI